MQYISEVVPHQADFVVSAVPRWELLFRRAKVDVVVRSTASNSGRRSCQQWRRLKAICRWGLLLASPHSNWQHFRTTGRGPKCRWGTPRWKHNRHRGRCWAGVRAAHWRWHHVLQQTPIHLLLLQASSLDVEPPRCFGDCFHLAWNLKEIVILKPKQIKLHLNQWKNLFSKSAKNSLKNFAVLQFLLPSTMSSSTSDFPSAIFTPFEARSTCWTAVFVWVRKERSNGTGDCEGEEGSSHPFSASSRWSACQALGTLNKKKILLYFP